MSGRELQFTHADYVVLIVDDLDRAVSFYTTVMRFELGHRSGPFAQLSTGATRIALYRRAAMAETLGYAIEAPSRRQPGFELGFKVADVDAAFATLVERGARPVTAPVTRPWGQRTAYVADPDGHLLELAQDLGRQAPAP